MQGSFSFAIQPFFDIYFGIIEKFHFNRNNGQIYCNHYFLKHTYFNTPIFDHLKEELVNLS